MKKLTLAFLGLIMSVCFLCGTAALPGELNAAADYAVSGFSELPADWSLYSECATDYVTEPVFADGGMQLGHRTDAPGPTAANYYGAMYWIDNDTEYTDFVFEMKFVTVDYLEVGRFFALAYHVQQDEAGNAIGYMMNYRFNGNSAPSVMYVNGNGARQFQDQNDLLRGPGNGNPVISTKGSEHTLRVEVEGNTARHYMDDKLIVEWDVTRVNSLVGGEPLTSGKFALIISRCVLNILSCTITDTSQSDAPAVPEKFADWQLNDQCDTAHTETSYTADTMSIRNTANVGGNLYYGSMYFIDPGQTYEDFTFEITLKMSNPVDARRWLGILYHTQTDENSNTLAYIMNFRYNGLSAASAVNANRAFQDETADQTAYPLTDGNWHTLKVEMAGTTARHYVDGTLIKEWDVTIKNSHLGTTLTSGGFALIVNQCVVEIKDYSITGSASDTPGGVEKFAGWQLNDQCDTAHTETSYTADTMSIRNTANVGGNLYYGSMYFIDPGQTYEDFSFEITLKMSNPVDANRWLGILYHTQTDENSNTLAYIMNYRYNGDSAFSAVNANRVFNDGVRHNVSKPLSDGDWHTLKVEMAGTTARHYVDDTLILEWNVTDRDAHLGTTLTSGGFALIVNQCVVEIKDYSITEITQPDTLDIPDTPVVPEKFAGWQLNDQCDTAHTETTYTADTMSIRNTASANNTLYYGSMYFIDPGQTYEDFSFEITLKMTNPVNAERWLGILYHTQTEGDNTLAYVMNFRYNGISASSAVNANRAFNDDSRIQTASPLSDGNWHTLKVEMIGSTARHYVDDVLIQQWDVTAKNAHLGTTLTSGGFALIVNQATVEIQSYSITSEVFWETEEDEPGIFTEMPANWELYDQCDLDATELTFDEQGNLVITHSNNTVSPSQYYGSMILIDTDKAYSDFTFEITLKMTDPMDGTRWLGVVYHTQTLGDSVIGYMMNYRYNGNTASSAINAGRSFADDPVNTGAPLSDGRWHTLKIEMTGTTARHYMDGELIKEWDVTSKDAHLAKTLTAGGFALIVNRSTVLVKNYSVSGTETRPVEENFSIVSTYQSVNILMSNAPTVVCDVTDQAVLDSLTTRKERPSNAILRFKEDYTIAAADGSSLGDFRTIFTNVLSGRIIPVLYLSTEGEADALVRFLSEEINIYDIAVMSDNAALVKRVIDANHVVRGIVSFAAGTDLYEIVSTANLNGAGVAVIPQSMATTENVRYLQGRFTTVWTTADSTSAMDLHNCVNSGVYGIIASDFSAVYAVLESYPAGSISRMPFNVAHRGLPGMYNENSISGALASIEYGATHLEMDAYLTSDGHIVMMHDATIDRTTNGFGNVESFTLEELRQYRLDEIEEEMIPTLGEVIEALDGLDIVLVLELKSGNIAIVDALKTLLDGCDFKDQLVVISFSLPILARMKAVLPEVPTANLNTASTTTFLSVLSWMGQYNTGIDTPVANASKEFNEAYLRDRGIIGWYWTYFSRAELLDATAGGYVGLTNDAAYTFCDVVLNVRGPEDLELTEIERGTDITLLAETYSGETLEVEGKIIFFEDMGEYWEVVASYTNGHTVFTRSFTILKDAGKVYRSCNAEVSASGSLLLFAVLAAAAGALLLKKKEA